MEEKSEALRIFKSFLKIIYEIIKTVALILLIFFIVRYFLIQPFIVDGNSMEPNFHNKDYLMVDKISYRFKQPQRGDVIIFHPPNSSIYYIKRIIGLPGDKVMIENDNIFIYNKQNPEGVELKEPYLADNTKTMNNITQTLQENEYYVLGDNRENSSDSREFGPITKSRFAGKAFLIVFPTSDFGAIKHQQYIDLLTLLSPLRHLLVQN